ncbi:MAG: DNA helicase RecQ [Pseudomonadales bacterium]|nr:DNA helicase RecQ [Pseudomonadales bacterium]
MGVFLLRWHTLDNSTEILQSVFGFDHYRGDQEAIINGLIGATDALVLMPTGGGKSLCYQIPALVRDGVGVVISPLIALMQDQVDSLVQLGVWAAFLNSSLDRATQYEIEQQLRQGELDLLYVAPERLVLPGMLALLAELDIALFAIDEAHCVSQWGHDFRADYLKLSVLAEQFPNVPRIALTATADERTRQEMIERLGMQDASVYISSFDRPNIRYQVAEKQNPRQQLLRFMRLFHSEDAGIVYCLSRKKVDDTAAWLADQGFNALPYHAGLSAEVRQQNQRRFLQDEAVIVVATIAFGMGIDKPDVRFVAHLDLPKNLEAYYQETGRAGRDGEPADAWMLYGLQDVVKLRQMLDGSSGTEEHKRVEFHKLEAMLGFAESTRCRRQLLLHYFGETLEQPCGNCDVCIDPPETWDGTEVAQKALSTVHRTGQRFGVAYLTDVLLGRSNQRIEGFGHDKLSTWGIGTELDQKQWRSVFRQLVARAYLHVDHEQYGAIKLVEKCRPILRGEKRIEFRKEAKKSSSKGGSSKPLRKQFSNSGSEDLWEALRALRKKLSDEQGVPPYVIFHDATLMEMVELKPENSEQMAAISGIGATKLEKYGEQFLSELNQFSHSAESPAEINDTAQESVRLCKQGSSLDEIVSTRGLVESTVINHLAAGIEQGTLELSDVYPVDEHELKGLSDIWWALSEDDRGRLKPFYEALDGTYEYSQLKCICAAFRFAAQSESGTTTSE